MKMTETTATKLSAFDELMELLDRMAQAKKKAYRELQEATAAQKAAQQAWNDAEFGFETGIADENDVRKAKKALEQAEEKLKMATARYEASNRAGALESIKQNEKVQALIAKAVEEAEKELTKHEQSWTAELHTIEKLKQQYLEAINRYYEIRNTANEITKQLRRVNEVIPNAIPSHLFAIHRQGDLAPHSLAISPQMINQYLYSR